MLGSLDFTGREGGIRTHGGSSPHLISSQAPSTTRTPLHAAVRQVALYHRSECMARNFSALYAKGKLQVQLSQGLVKLLANDSIAVYLVVKIYNFDHALRHLWLEYIELIEVKMKAIYAYEIAKAHGPLLYQTPNFFLIPQSSVKF